MELEGRLFRVSIPALTAAQLARLDEIQAQFASAIAVRDVAEALKKSAESATKLVPTLAGYRAGLMGSIAAACTAAHTVGLSVEGKPR